MMNYQSIVGFMTRTYNDMHLYVCTKCIHVLACLWEFVSSYHTKFKYLPNCILYIWMIVGY